MRLQVYIFGVFLNFRTKLEEIQCEYWESFRGQLVDQVLNYSNKEREEKGSKANP